MEFKIENYQELAKRTCASLGNEKLDLSHMILGLVSEQSEWMTAIANGDSVNYSEEVADIFWYLANYCTFRGYSFYEIYEQSKNLPFDNTTPEYETLAFYFEYSDTRHEIQVMSMVSQLSDLVKKYVAYNKPIDKELELTLLQYIVGIFYTDEAYNTPDNFYFDFHRDLKNNIEKLQKRYPEKFTEENALNRDLDAERKILEQK